MNLKYYVICIHVSACTLPVYQLRAVLRKIIQGILAMLHRLVSLTKKAFLCFKRYFHGINSSFLSFYVDLRQPLYNLTKYLFTIKKFFSIRNGGQKKDTFYFLPYLFLKKDEDNYFIYFLQINQVFQWLIILICPQVEAFTLIPNNGGFIFCNGGYKLLSLFSHFNFRYCECFLEFHWKL